MIPEKAIAILQNEIACRKRVPFTNIFDRIQRRNPNRVITAEDLEVIRQTMIGQGYEVACALCYVEERRQKLGEIAEEFGRGDFCFVFLLRGS